MRRAPALNILENLRREMTAFTKNRPLMWLAQQAGLDQAVCWRILHSGRAASFSNVEKLLAYFGYRLVKDEGADQSRHAPTATARTAKPAAGGKAGRSTTGRTSKTT